ncbi:MAG: 50S ribosome-binding GTPase, partial [Gammaproteobacteria bacterium]|nr:50S ribosome-binding GTPase [Gammaproteobacteria bacterium]
MNQPAETLSAFIERLREKYSSAAAATKESANESPSRAVLELTLGSAALRDYQLRRSGAISLPQIAVVGPTQVGKSTVVNLLLGRDLALVSSLAGYTKHLQGFAVGSNEPGLRGIERYFGAWEQRGQQDLEPDEVRTYSLTQVPETNTLLADRPYLVWDTPDFDSFSSRRYRASVMEIIGSSDLILVVLSKEKYGDLSVWNMLGLIRGLKKRIIIAVNKLPGDACTLILDSVHQRLTEHGLAEPVIKVVPLPYVAGATLEFVHDESAAVLRSVVGDNLSMDAAADRVSKAAVFIHEHWPDWISPVKVEHQCEAEWRAAVDQTVKEGADFYRQQYLETQQYDTFRRAVIRLLELLEVPALA